MELNENQHRCLDEAIKIVESKSLVLNKLNDSVLTNNIELNSMYIQHIKRILYLPYAIIFFLSHNSFQSDSVVMLANFITNECKY